MRYYNIVITNPTSGQVVRNYTSFVNGKTDPNALNIEIDAPVAASAEPTGDVGALVRIWGIPLTDIAQSNNLNGMNIKVFAGMQKGLPLANPAQAGLIVQGTIFQAFGNWIGVNMTLDLQILPGLGSASNPANIALNWLKGQPMGPALQQALQIAFPKYTVTQNVSSALVFSEDQKAVYQSVTQLAQWAKEFSKPIIGGDYGGVSILVQQNAIKIVDSTVQGSPVNIEFNDLIGQITWKAPKTVQITCVMRATPTVLDYVKLPPGQVTISQASLSQFRQGSVFQGTFQIVSTRHVGNFRQPEAEAWITTYDAVQA